MALPITIFIITLITLLLSTGFTRVKADGEITVSAEEVANALAVAQSGLQTYFSLLPVDACSRPARPVDGDSVQINVVGGYAWVTSHVVRKPLDTLSTWLYIVRSTGYSIVPAISSSPRAQRTIAQFARWQPGAIVHNAAWVAANGVTGKADAGATGELKGDDQAAAGCKVPSLNPVRVPTGEGPSDISGFVTNGPAPTVLESGTPMQVANSTGIDWAAVLAGGITPEYTSAQFGNWDYTVQFLTGNVTLGAPGTNYTGTGLLIVTGDLTIQGSFFQWWGVILVGGRIIFDAADQRFDGWIVSGLNEQLGINVAVTQLGSFANNTDIDFDTQTARLGMTGLSGWVPIRNAWMDNWAAY